jgi:hypothetical protein
MSAASRLVWLVRRRAAGFAVALGGLLVAGAMALQWLAVLPLEQRVAQLQAREEARRDGALDRLGQVLDGPDTPQTQLAAFYAYFARNEDLPRRLERVHTVAHQLGLEMKRADYRLASHPDRKIDRYQMVIPVRGDYPTIRAFVTAVLREQPTLSLEQIQLQRKDIGEMALDTEITFTFYLAK